MYITIQDFIEATVLVQNWNSYKKEKKQSDFLNQLSNKKALFLLDFYHSAIYDQNIIFKNFGKDFADNNCDFIDLQKGVKAIILAIFEKIDKAKLVEFSQEKKYDFSTAENSHSISDIIDCLRIKLEDKIPFYNSNKLHTTGNYYIDENEFFPIEYIQRLGDHCQQGMNTDLIEYIKKRQDEIQTISQKVGAMTDEIWRQYKEHEENEVCEFYPKELIALSKIYQFFSCKPEQIRSTKSYTWKTNEDWCRFQKKLNHRLDSIDMSQKKLATLTGLTEKKIGQFCTGEQAKFTRMKSLISISYALQCTLDYLLDKSNFEFAYSDPSGTEWLEAFKRYRPEEFIALDLAKSKPKYCADTLNYIYNNSEHLSDENFGKINEYVKKLLSEPKNINCNKSR